jgi:UDP-N-acetylmuramate dehydrogenase
MDPICQASLSRYTTLKVGGTAEQLFQPSSTEELVNLLEQLKRQGINWHVIGGGSNLLVSSGGISGAVIRTAMMTGIKTIDTNILEAEAGARLPHLAKYAASIGLSGLEFAVGIPGTVGGAVVMNAGAHGSCTANIIENVTLFDTEKFELKTLGLDELKFEYRKSFIDPNKHIVVSARLKLKVDNKDNIEAKTRENEEYRWRTQPIGWPNAGSTFKNPSLDKSAGFLLDKAGAKELKEGQAAVSAIHANFVINLGGATSDEVVKLLADMQNSVMNTFQIRLKPEWKTLGEFSQAEREVWNI